MRGDALVEDGVAPAHRAHCRELRDVLGKCHERRQWFERITVEGHAQSLDDDIDAAGEELLDRGHEVGAEELGLIDGDEVDVLGSGRLGEGGDVSDGNGGHGHPDVGGDGGELRPGVEGMADDQRFDTGDAGATDPAHELFGLAGEHRAGDDLEATTGAGWCVHDTRLRRLTRRR